MPAILIKSNNSKNLKLLAEIATALGMSVNKYNYRENDDKTLGLLMNREKTGKMVSRKAIFKLIEG